jgi:uncharacterized protein YlxW (UPF0749 family)
MSLLADIAGQALDPGYAIAASRRSGDGDGGQPHRGSPVLVVGVLLATLLVVVAAVQAHVRAPAAARTRADLVASVRRESAAVAALARQVDALQQRAAKLRERSLSGSVVGADLAATLRAQEVVAGQAPVTGPGLRVSLDDTRLPNAGNRLQDRDLQVVVNALWAAGAEAVAVNGQRLTSRSAIREAGEAILVDFQPLTAPYVITAVGDPQRLQSGYDDSSGAARIRAYEEDNGLRVQVRRVDSLRLPAAAEGTLHYAHPIATPTSGDTR